MTRWRLGGFALVVASVAAATPASAQDPYAEPAVRAGAATARRALALEPTFRALDDGRSRVSLEIRGVARVGVHTAERRRTYHLEGATIAPGASGGALVASYEWSPVYSVRLVEAPGGADLVIELSQPTEASERITTSARGMLVEVDFPRARAAPSPSPAAPVAEPAAPAAIPAPPPPAVVRQRAPEPGAEEPPPRYLVPLRFQSAFVGNHLGLRLDAGYAAFDLPASADHGGGRVKVASSRESFEVGARLHERVGLDGFIGAAVASGVDQATQDLLGTDAAVTWSAGLLGVIVARPHVGLLVGARLGFEGGAGREVRPIRRAASEAVDEGEAPSLSSVLASQHDFGARFHVHAAEAVGRHLSAQLTAGWVARRRSLSFKRAGEPVERSARSTDASIGIAAAASAQPVLPVAVQLEYAADVPLLNDPAPATGTGSLVSTEDTQIVALGVHYVGRPDLALGVAVGVEVHRIEALHPTRGGTLFMRYFF